MPRKKRVVSIEVLSSVLKLSVNGFVKILQNLRSRRLRFLKMAFYLLYEYSKALSPITKLLWAAMASLGTFEHDPRVTEMHLRATDRIAIAVVLGKAKGLIEPCNGFLNILIDNVRQQDISGNRAIRYH